MDRSMIQFELTKALQKKGKDTHSPHTKAMYKTWVDDIEKKRFQVDVFKQALDEFAVDPRANDLGQLYYKINSILQREEREAQAEQYKWKDIKPDPNSKYKPIIAEIFDNDDPKEMWTLIRDHAKVWARRYRENSNEKLSKLWVSEYNYACKKIEELGGSDAT